MKANQDKTGKMGSASKPNQLECTNQTGNSVHGRMKDVAVKKAANMKLTKTGGVNHRGNI